jgi:hypothetical protein
MLLTISLHQANTDIQKLPYIGVLHGRTQQIEEIKDQTRTRFGSRIYSEALMFEYIVKWRL